MQLVTSVLFLGPFLWGGRASGFPLDDAWIHQVVARTFAETGTLGYLPGAYGAGATSYLWAALLGLGQKVHAHPVVWTSAFGILGALGTGQALLSLVSDEELDDVVAVALACAGGDLTWFAVSGMEASFVAAAALGAIAVATSSHRRAPVAAGVLAGVAALTRPDFVPLGLVVAGVVFARRRSRKDALAALAPWVVACLLYFGSNALLAGTPMPATMRGRRWLWIDSVQGKASAASLAVEFVFAWAYRLRQFTLGLETNVVFWIATGLAGAGVLAAVRQRRVGLLVAAGFTLFHAAVFVVVLPVPGHGGRYQPLVPVLFVLFAVLGSFHLARSVATTPRSRLAGLGVLGTLWLVCLGNAYWEWHLAHRAAVEHVRRTEVAAGLAVRELPPEAVVASFDVGGIGYFSRRSLLDLGALTTPKVMVALDHDDVVDLLRREKVTHLVLPAGEDQDFPDLSNFGFRLRVVDHPEVALTEVASFASDHDTWLRGVWYTQNATFRQRLWKVGFTSCDASAANLPPLAPDVAASAGARAWGGEGSDASRLARAFEAAAARGLCVRVRGPGASSPLEKATGCWDVDVRYGSETPAPGMPLSVQAELVSAPVVDEELRAAKEMLARATAEHRLAGDVKGVTFASLHAVAAAVRAKAPCFWTPLPAMERALPPGWRPPPTPKDTLGLGVVLVGLVLGASIVVTRRRASA